MRRLTCCHGDVVDGICTVIWKEFSSIELIFYVMYLWCFMEISYIVTLPICVV